MLLYAFFSRRSILSGELPDTVQADIFALEGSHIKGAVAENAGRLILLQTDLVAVHVDLQRIPLVDVQRTAQLDGQHNPSQFIDLPNNSRRFHEYP